MLNLTTDGFLKDLYAWDSNIALELAARDNLMLTSEHWLIIHYIRQFYLDYQTTPPIRAMVNLLKQNNPSQSINSAYLHHLFPLGPSLQSSRLAGLPKPTRCM
ncbi:MAG: tusE [Francisellaceae bacterium]|nr:tusE [Francisellaceae bacterium]